MQPRPLGHPACLGLVILLAACAGRPERGESVRPGINDRYYQETEVSAWKGRFERPEREIFARRAEIVRRLGLAPGLRVADIGTGTGFLALEIARAVGPGGRVYAVDLMPYFVAHVRERAQAAGLAQVEAVPCREDDVRLPAQCVDLAVLCDVYHHFEFPEASLASIHRALDPAGELVLIDFRRVEGESSEWVLGHVRAGQDVFEREIEAAGFEKVGEESFLASCYFVRFRKRDRTAR